MHALVRCCSQVTGRPITYCRLELSDVFCLDVRLASNTGAVHVFRRGLLPTRRVSDRPTRTHTDPATRPHEQLNSSELSFCMPELIFEGSRGAPGRGTAMVDHATSYWDTTYPCLSV